MPRSCPVWGLPSRVGPLLLSHWQSRSSWTLPPPTPSSTSTSLPSSARPHLPGHWSAPTRGLSTLRPRGPRWHQLSSGTPPDSPRSPLLRARPSFTPCTSSCSDTCSSKTSSFVRPQGDDPILRDAKADVRRHLSSLEGRGFGCCEFSKVVFHLLHHAR